MSESLGIIETRGLTAAIDVADSMLKVVNVVKVVREVGEESAIRLGKVVDAHVFPRPNGDISKLLPELK